MSAPFIDDSSAVAAGADHLQLYGQPRGATAALLPAQSGTDRSRGDRVSSIDLKTNVPHSARIYDYLLGGKDNYQADRDAAAALMKNVPTVPISMIVFGMMSTVANSRLMK